MQRHILSLKRKILVNPESKLYDIVASIMLALGFIFLCVVLTLILSIFFGAVFYRDIVIDINQTQDIILSLLLFSLPATICYSILPILGLIKFKKWKFANLGLQFKTDKRSIFIKVICSILLLISLVQLFSKYNMDMSLRMFFVFLFIAINEEILVRGILFNLLNERFKKLFSVLLASVIFSFFLHSGGEFLPNLLVRLPLSIILFVPYMYSGDIYSSMILHFAYNVFVNSL